MFYRVVFTVLIAGVISACEGSALAPAAVVAGGSPETATLSHDREVALKGTLTGTISQLASNPAGCPIGYSVASEGTGTLSHVGRVSFQAWHCRNLTGEMAGESVLTTPNGDKLFNSYVIRAIAVPVVGEELPFVGTSTTTGGTGRFEGATGTSALRAWVLWVGDAEGLNWPARWEMEGQGTFRH